MPFGTVEKAIQDIKDGKFVVVAVSNIPATIIPPETNDSGNTHAEIDIGTPVSAVVVQVRWSEVPFSKSRPIRHRRTGTTG